jgi:hypothetical protein
VHNLDFDGKVDGLFCNKGADCDVTLDDAVLMARPLGLHERAQASNRRKANIPIQTTEQAIGHGIPGVTGSDHKTAIAGNRITKTFERIAEGD